MEVGSAWFSERCSRVVPGFCCLFGQLWKLVYIPALASLEDANVAISFL